MVKRVAVKYRLIQPTSEPPKSDREVAHVQTRNCSSRQICHYLFRSIIIPRLIMPMRQILSWGYSGGVGGPPIRVSGFFGHIWCPNAQGVTSYPPAARNAVRTGCSAAGRTLSIKHRIHAANILNKRLKTESRKCAIKTSGMSVEETKERVL